MPITPYNFMRSQMAALPVSQQITAFSPDQTVLRAAAEKPIAEVPEPEAALPEIQLPETTPTRQTDDPFQVFGKEMMEKYFDPEFRNQLIKDKLRLGQAEMNQAYMMGRLRDMPKEMKAGYQEAGNLLGQYGANMANIMGSTRIPVGDFSGDPIPQLQARQYFN